MDIVQVVGQLGRSMRAELDLEAEANNARRFAAIYAGHPAIRVPAVHDVLSNKTRLVLELCAGQPVAAFLPNASDAERKPVLEHWLETVLEQVFVHGLVHTDPHPGNFLWDGQRLTLLDFGSVMALPDPVRKGYIAIVRSILSGNEATLAQALTDLGFAAEGGVDSLAAVAREMLGGIKDPARMAAFRADPSAMVEALLVRLKAASSVEIPDHFVMIGRVLGALAGQMIRYGSGVDVTRAFAKTLLRAR